MSNKNKGIYKKFHVTRTDGKSELGEKHHDCAYFVLDVNCDPFAVPALRAYAEACKEEYPRLSADLLAWCYKNGITNSTVPEKDDWKDHVAIASDSTRAALTEGRKRPMNDRVFLDDDGDICVTREGYNLVACSAVGDDGKFLNFDVISELVLRFNDYQRDIEAARKEGYARAMADVKKVAAAYGGDNGLQPASGWSDEYADAWNTGNADCAAAIESAIDSLSPTPSEPAMSSFQERVAPWMDACFSPEISADLVERNHRFLEEALELVQSTGCTKDDAMALVHYVYSRDIGDPPQEVGGVMVTLAALCLAAGMDMHECGEAELSRIWTKVEQIRARQAAKPTGSALTQEWALPSDQVAEAARVLADLMKERRWLYYPIEIPLTESGEGPAIVGEDAASIVYEVWEAGTLRTLSSHECLPDAIEASLRAIAEQEKIDES